MYHWETENWPNFEFDVTSVDSAINEYFKNAYKMEGALSQLSESDLDNACVHLLVEEAINTSAIEGEKLNREKVRSSVAGFLGIKEPGEGRHFSKEKGIAAMLVEVRKSISLPMSKELLCHWHNLLLTGSEEYCTHPIIKGDYRNLSIDVIKEDLYGETETIYTAPGEDRKSVECEMDAFFKWYNNKHSLSGPVKAAIAHLWFVAIHPFQDGNGRVGRAIAEHALFQDFERPPLFSMSTVINAKRVEYYQQLRNTNSTLHVTKWLVWFAELVKESQDRSLASIEFALEKSKFWAAYGEVKLNSRQEKVMKKVFSAGADGFVRDGLTNEKYRAITGAPTATATRDLRSLVENGLICPFGEGKRGLRYFVNFPERRDLFGSVAPSSVIDDERLTKLLKKIERNLRYFRGEKNLGLEKLLDEHKVLADGNEKAQRQLQAILDKYFN